MEQLPSVLSQRASLALAFVVEIPTRISRIWIGTGIRRDEEGLNLAVLDDDDCLPLGISIDLGSVGPDAFLVPLPPVIGLPDDVSCISPILVRVWVGGPGIRGRAAPISP